MKVLGVVLGVDKYAEGAMLAAKRNEEMTGLPFVVMDSRPAQLEHDDFPGYSKLFFFDFFDADVIVYLDADLVLLKPWNMDALVHRPELVAVKDRYIDDYPHWGPEVERARYFNSGFFIANRVHHASLFERAVEIWRAGEISFGLRDQSALNHAVRLSHAPLHLIDQRYNYLRYHLRSDTDRKSVVGAHFTPHGYSDDLSRVYRTVSLC